MYPVRHYGDNEYPYNFVIDLNDTPAGFEDILEESNWANLLRKNQAFVEFKPPAVDNHVDPRIALTRQLEIHTNRICAHVRIQSSTQDKVFCSLKPYGPHAEVIPYLDSIKKLYVAPRLIYDLEGDLVNIVTFDVIEMN